MPRWVRYGKVDMLRITAQACLLCQLLFLSILLNFFLVSVLLLCLSGRVAFDNRQRPWQATELASQKGN